MNIDGSINGTRGLGTPLTLECSTGTGYTAYTRGLELTFEVSRATLSTIRFLHESETYEKITDPILIVAWSTMNGSNGS